MLPLNRVHGVFGTGKVYNRRPREFHRVIGFMVAVTDKSWTATRLHDEFIWFMSGHAEESWRNVMSYRAFVASARACKYFTDEVNIGVHAVVVGSLHNQAALGRHVHNRGVVDCGGSGVHGVLFRPRRGVWIEADTIIFYS
jgi:hypothetical protein